MNKTFSIGLTAETRLYAQIFQEVIRHHRNQMRYLSRLMREHSLPRSTGMKLMKSHAEEIKSLLRKTTNGCARLM